jgi:uncharacterized Zn finger protein
MTDNCPDCGHPRNQPQLVIPVGAGTEETYRCRHCGHQWWTAWGPVDAEDWPETG